MSAVSTEGYSEALGCCGLGDRALEVGHGDDVVVLGGERVFQQRVDAFHDRLTQGVEGGHPSPRQAVAVGIAFLLLRQSWTVRMGMRGIVVRDVYQGIFAYGLGGLLI